MCFPQHSTIRSTPIVIAPEKRFRIWGERDEEMLPERRMVGWTDGWGGPFHGEDSDGWGRPFHGQDLNGWEDHHGEYPEGWVRPFHGEGPMHAKDLDWTMAVWHWEQGGQDGQGIREYTVRLLGQGSVMYIKTSWGKEGGQGLAWKIGRTI